MMCNQVTLRQGAMIKFLGSQHLASSFRRTLHVGMAVQDSLPRFLGDCQQVGGKDGRNL